MFWRNTPNPSAKQPLKTKGHCPKSAGIPPRTLNLEDRPAPGAGPGPDPDAEGWGGFGLATGVVGKESGIGLGCVGLSKFLVLLQVLARESTSTSRHPGF